VCSLDRPRRLEYLGAVPALAGRQIAGILTPE